MDAEVIKELLKQQQDFFNSLITSQKTWMEKHLKDVKASPGTASSASQPVHVPAFHPFEKGKHQWDSYLMQLNQHFSAYCVADSQQKRSFFLSWIGSELFDLSQKLFGSEDVQSKSFEEITTKLTEHFKRNIHVLAARYEFFRAKMAQGQSYADWVAELRGLARNCKYICTNDKCKQEFIDSLLRDTIVINTPHDAVRNAALQKANPSLEDVLLIAESFEATRNTVNVLQNNGQFSNLHASEVYHVEANSSKRGSRSASAPRNNGKRSNYSKSCSGCGVNHKRENCKFREAVCHNCNRSGHIAPVCMAFVKNNSGRRHSNNRSRSRKNFSGHFSKRVENIESINVTPTDQSLDFVNVIGIQKQTLPAMQSFDIVNEIDVQPRRDGNKIVIKIKVNDSFIDFQVDTGASCSMIGMDTYKQLQCPRLRPADLVLKAYGDISVPVLGKTYVKVKYGTSEKILPLIVTKVTAANNIFGIDWLDAFGLYIKQDSINALSPDLSTKQVDDLCNKFDSVFKNSLGCCSSYKAHLHLKHNATPKFFRARPIPFAQMEGFKKEAERLVSAKIWKPIKFSSWAAPVVVVPKRDGQVRICGDFKAVNAQLDVDQYPIPRVEELIHKLRGARYFSKLDLSDAYLQVELDEESKALMVVNTPLGLFQYQRLPFGVASAPAIFQRLLEQVIAGIPNCVNYLDDIVIAGANFEEHLHGLKEVFKRLQSNGLVCNRDKCFFLKSQVDYLGHTISFSGVTPSESNVTAIRKLPRPSNLKELQAFLGKINYYNKFIKNFSQIAAPLNRLRQKNIPFVWTNEQEQAYQNLKHQLADATLLSHFSDDLPIVLATDASSHGIGAVISHVLPDGSEIPIAHASKTLNTHQRRYSQIEKEALSIIYGVQKFNQYLYGRTFILYTDHKPLVSIFSPDKNLPVYTALRLQRWALLLMAYRFSIRYKPTAQHANADALSRLPMGPDDRFDLSKHSCLHVNFVQELVDFPIDANRIKQITRVDPILKRVCYFIHNGWPDKLSKKDKDLKPYFERRFSLSVEHDVILLQTEYTRVVVPAELQPKVLNMLHSGHWGITRMKQLSRRYCWWPAIDRSITEQAGNCLQCQQSSGKPRQEFSTWPAPNYPWQRIHLDFAGPFLDNMWLICIDAFSKYPFVVKMTSTTSNATIQALQGIFALEGLPDTIVTDNGRQFVSVEFKEFCKLNGIEHLTSAPFHPASNGEAERFVRTFKTSLKKSVDGGKDKASALLNLLSTFRTTPNPITGKSPAEILHGRQPKVPLSLLFPRPQRMRNGPPSRFNYKQLVLVKNFSRGPSWLRGVVLKQLGRMMYLVATPFGVWRRHQNQLKPRQPFNEVADDFLIADRLAQSTLKQASIKFDESNHAPCTSSSLEPTPENATTVPVVKPETPPATPTLRRSARLRKPVVRFQLST